jgi:carboxyl-terminal processing protease
VVTKVEEGVMIEQVLKGYPAYKAGLRPLDIIIKINGEPTKDMSLAEAVSKIRGPAGTEVTLTIYRPSENKVFDVTIKREKIVVPSVTYEVYTLTG